MRPAWLVEPELMDDAARRLVTRLGLRATPLLRVGGEPVGHLVTNRTTRGAKPPWCSSAAAERGLVTKKKAQADVRRGLLWELHAVADEGGEFRGVRAGEVSLTYRSSKARTPPRSR